MNRRSCGRGQNSTFRYDWGKFCSVAPSFFNLNWERRATLLCWCLVPTFDWHKERTIAYFVKLAHSCVQERQTDRKKSSAFKENVEDEKLLWETRFWTQDSSLHMRASTPNATNTTTDVIICWSIMINYKGISAWIDDGRLSLINYSRNAAVTGLKGSGWILDSR